MTNFKQLLDALFKTRTTPTEAGAANSPNFGGAITIYSGTSTDQVTYTAPDDGFVYQHVNGYPSAGYSDITVNNLRAFLCRTEEAASLVRVKKGDVVKFSTISFDNLVARSAKFVSLLGGGYRSLLKALQSGGATCLRLNNCLTLGRKGSANQRALQELKLLRPCQATGITPTSPQLMEESVFSQESACLFASPITTPEKCTTSGSGASKMFAIYLQPLSVRKGTASTSTTTKILGHHQICDAFSSLTKALPSFSANCEEVHYVA